MTEAQELPSVAECRRRLEAMRDECERKRSDGRHKCARSAEWAEMVLETRMAVLLLAGMDGELSELSQRAWGEFTPAEKLAVQVAMRSLYRSLERAVNIRMRG